MRRFLWLSLAALLLASIAVASSGGATRATARGVGEPASAKIAFSRGYPYGGGGAIWTVGSDGSGLQRVTHPPKGSGDGFPSWSPDRQQIAFYRLVPNGEDDRGDTVYRSDLMIVRADGSALHRLLPGAYSDRPAWSPDGKWLLFLTYKRTERITKIRADGTGLKTIVTGKLAGLSDTHSPVWSPSGREIAFTQWIDAQERDWYFVVSANGGRPRLLIPSFTSGNSSSALAWSPNGREIAFFSSPASCIGGCDEGVDGRRWLYVARWDGSGLRKLVAGVSGSSPQWSPDGSRLLVERGGGDIGAVPDSAFVVNPLSGELRRVASNTDGVRWSADGRSIAFVRHRGESQPGDLYVVKASGESAKLVVRGAVEYGDFDW